MARLPIPGQDSNTWGDTLNDYLQVAHTTDGNIKPAAVGSTNIQNGSIGDTQISAISQSKVTGLTAVLSSKATDADIVHNTGNETIAGIKTFTGIPSVPDGSFSSAKLSFDPATQAELDGLSTTVSGKAASGANSDITSLSGLSTPLSVLQGGTGGNSAQTAINTLSGVAAATNEYVLTKDTGSGNAVFKAPLTVPNVNEQTFTVTSALAVSTGGPRWYSPYALTITEVRASVGTSPTGASVVIDVNKNGTTIFTTQSNRPTIAAGNNTDLADAINVSSVAAGDYLTVDIDQVGSTTPGSDLTVTFRYTVS